MNAVEIEEAISALAEQPFEPTEFAFAFLEAFGNKATTLKRLRTGTSNKSDIGGVLQINNIHIKVCESGTVMDTLTALKESSATAKARAKFVLATDGAYYKSHAFTTACAELGLRHIHTKPYMPRTNGKAGRFIQTALREWAYVRRLPDCPINVQPNCRSGPICTIGTGPMVA